MNQAQKIEYVRRYLQAKLEEGFPYPFQVVYEEGAFVFTLKNGKKECRAKSHQAKEVMETVLKGDEERKKALIDRIFQILQAAVSAQESTALSGISDYEKIRGELILRPLALREAGEALKEVPHVRFGDVALVLYAVMAHVGNDYFTVKIRREQTAGWEREEKDVLEEALVNTSFLYPPRLYRVEDLLSWDHKRHGDGRFMEEGAQLCHSIRGYVLTNTLEINGAIALFYPGVAERIGAAIGEDFYIAFTSIHEAQVHAVGTLSPEVIRESLKDTNRHCNRREDILTNRVYRYCREEKRFAMLVDGEWVEVGNDVG